MTTAGNCRFSNTCAIPVSGTSRIPAPFSRAVQKDNQRRVFQIVEILWCKSGVLVLCGFVAYEMKRHGFPLKICTNCHNHSKVGRLQRVRLVRTDRAQSSGTLNHRHCPNIAPEAPAYPPVTAPDFALDIGLKSVNQVRQPDTAIQRLKVISLWVGSRRSTLVVPDAA